jgi:GDP-L-fucose synthase
MCEALEKRFFKGNGGKIMKILILGASGTLGRSLVNELTKETSFQILAPKRNELELSNYSDIENKMYEFFPDLVINSAGRVGGVKQNVEKPHHLMMENVLPILNVHRAMISTNIKEYFYLAPACVYPSDFEGEVNSGDLWKGRPEITSLPYATTKLLGIELIRAANAELGINWKILVPTNIFGEGDWQHLETGHVISMLVEKIFHASKTNNQIEIWGSGNQLRDFLSANDLAKFIRFIIKEKIQLPEITNISGYGEISIRGLAHLLKKKMGYEGDIVFNLNKPEGALRKKLSSSDLDKLGFKHSNSLDSALDEYLEKYYAAKAIK